ncbi:MULTISPECIES: alanine racemase [Fusobacterium]|uniref:alanine racemase n=1 Tax=Fusobacterium TaxID=848 RepID=UPI001476ACFD|nr:MULTISPECIES: alanine racemase [Fusobacterium]NME35550.1 alanine racemase [Fusobacterium sp. FSA-380-WT-3A]
MRTWLEINTKNLKYNIEKIYEKIGNKKIIGIVKANSYGLGSVEITKELIKCGVDFFAVATLSEGMELRKAGIKEKILILGGVFDEELREVEKYDLQIALSRFEQLVYIHKNNIQVKCHLAIETGMGRIGVNSEEAEKIKEYVNKNKLTNIIGVYTHLSVADEEGKDNRLYTERQIEKFNNFTGIDTIEYRHVLNSGGILKYSNKDNGNYVRVGIVMYGICGENWIEDLKPVITFKSKVLFIKTLIEDTDISYGRECTLKKGDIVGTIAAGYADGFKRGALNKITVKIKNREYTVVGKVCMDMLMIKIPNELKDEVKIGEEVILYGEDLVEKAKLLGTTTYEIITGINTRVKRVYIEE